MNRRAVTSEEADKAESVTIPVVNEEVRLDTEIVETGTGVRVKKTISEREEVIDEPLIRDEVVFERVAINEIVEGPLPTNRREGQTLIVPVLEEVLVFEKRTMLKEEIHIARRSHEIHETHKAVLRTEHVSAERIDDSADNSGQS